MVKKGIAHLSLLHGEVWFKLDNATNAGLRGTNHAGIPPEASPLTRLPENRLEQYAARRRVWATR